MNVAISLVERVWFRLAFASETVSNVRNPSSTPSSVEIESITTIQSPSGIWSIIEPLESVTRERIHPVSELINLTF